MSFKLFSVLIIAAIFTVGGQAQSVSRKFDFGVGKPARGYTQVSATDVYNKGKGFGLETDANINCLDRAGKDRLRSDFCTSDKPFYFSTAVPEGNYRVTITFGDAQEASVTTVKAELRRLMLEKVETKAGEFVKKSFVINVRTPQISGTNGEVKLKDRERTTEWWAWDEKLTLEFNNSRPAIAAVEIERVEVPTIYLLGDSTVCDQPREPYASWGQMLTAFFKPDAAIANHAESGESLKSSLGAKRLDKVLSLLKKGDYVLIQFAHNDEKEKGAGVGALTTFKASLKQYVVAVLAKGGTPILITPMHRRTFDEDGKIKNSHGDYPAAVRQAATEEKVSLIDLTTMSEKFYEALGKEKSGAAFKEGDGTHHNNYGSYELAKMVAGWMRSNRFDIAKYLIKNLPPLGPGKPDAPENFRLPASPLISDVKPLGS